MDTIKSVSHGRLSRASIEHRIVCHDQHCVASNEEDSPPFLAGTTESLSETRTQQAAHERWRPRICHNQAIVWISNTLMPPKSDLKMQAILSCVHEIWSKTELKCYVFAQNFIWGKPTRAEINTCVWRCWSTCFLSGPGVALTDICSSSTKPVHIIWVCTSVRPLQLSVFVALFEEKLAARNICPIQRSLLIKLSTWCFCDCHFVCSFRG